MANYDDFSRFYDQAMGDRTKEIKNIDMLISKAHPKAKTLLELACGTGEIMGSLKGDFKLTGLDWSNKMLAVAKKKLPKAKFVRQNMSAFRLQMKFDLIFSVFDSINHLLTLREWEKCFLSSYNHLHEGGVFIFDINVLGKLKVLAEQPTRVRHFGENVMLMKVRTATNKFLWDVKIFEHQKKNLYRLHQEKIKEVSFPLKLVKSKLLEIFDRVEMLDLSGGKASEKSQRVYFVCTKLGSKKSS